jgi:aryl-alcohol dehydrogenase-like predicted oxidoreductase
MTYDPFLDRRPPGSRPLVVLGTMNLGSRTPERASRAVLERALERGVRVFDTANLYGNGAAERLLRHALAGLADVRIATKVGLMPIKGRPEGLAPERLRIAVLESLERLGRDGVDLLYLHAPDRNTPIDETLGAVRDLVHAGRVRHFGVSNFAAWEVLEMMLACDRLGLERPRVSQVLMNAAIRQVEVEYLRFAAKYALHTTVYNPLAGGLFARELTLEAPAPKGSRFDGNARYRRRYWSERLFAFKDRLGAAAASHGLALPDAAYGWLAAQPGVDSILVGPSEAAHVDAAVDALARPVPEGLLTAVADAQRDFDGTDASYAR